MQYIVAPTYLAQLTGISAIHVSARIVKAFGWPDTKLLYRTRRSQLPKDFLDLSYPAQVEAIRQMSLN